jgi:hypothetical protein
LSTIRHLSTAPPASQRRELEDRLREEMLAARREFDRAAEVSKSLLRPSGDRNNPPENLTPEAARKAWHAAYERYVTALHRFTDLILRGEAPKGM